MKSHTKRVHGRQSRVTERRREPSNMQEVSVPSPWTPPRRPGAAAPPRAHLGQLQAFPAMPLGAQEPFSLLEGNTAVGTFGLTSHPPSDLALWGRDLQRCPTPSGPRSAQALPPAGQLQCPEAATPHPTAGAPGVAEASLSVDVPERGRR